MSAQSVQTEITDAFETASDQDTDSSGRFDLRSLSAADDDHQRPAVLEHFYNERGMSAEQIAREVFDEEISGETIRLWVNKHGLNPDTDAASGSSTDGAKQLAELGAIARKNGDSLIETDIDELRERYGDALSRPIQSEPSEP